jgi:hypothetical protein
MAEPASHPPGNSSMLSRFGALVKWPITWILDKFISSDLLCELSIADLEPCQMFEGVIRKVFFCKTDSIGDASWASVHTRLRDMPLGEARGIWQTIANEVAEDCFGEDGNVDVERLGAWMGFLRNVENFRAEPYRFIPHVELMRSQMHMVCELFLLIEMAQGTS